MLKSVVGILWGRRGDFNERRGKVRGKCGDLQGGRGDNWALVFEISLIFLCFA